MLIEPLQKISCNCNLLTHPSLGQIFLCNQSLFLIIIEVDPKAQPSFRGYLDNVEQTYWPNIHVYELCLQIWFPSNNFGQQFHKHEK
jgi:hypothetical protein